MAASRRRILAEHGGQRRDGGRPMREVWEPALPNVVVRQGRLRSAVEGVSLHRESALHFRAWLARGLARAPAARAPLLNLPSGERLRPLRVWLGRRASRHAAHCRRKGPSGSAGTGGAGPRARGGSACSRKSSALPPRSRIGAEVVLPNRDTRLHNHHIGPTGEREVAIADVLPSRRDPSVFGLNKLAVETWTITGPDGTVVNVSSRRTASIDAGNLLNFGPVKREIRG